MIAIEKCPRREGFSEGARFLGADGASWHYPVLDEAAYDRFPEIRDYLETFIVRGDGKVTEESTQALSELIVALLVANYELGPESLDGLLLHDGRISGDSKTTLMQTLNDRLLMALFVVDLEGEDRSEVNALLLVQKLGGVPLGWGEHENGSFSN